MLWIWHATLEMESLKITPAVSLLMKLVRNNLTYSIFLIFFFEIIDEILTHINQQYFLGM